MGIISQYIIFDLETFFNLNRIFYISVINKKFFNYGNNNWYVFSFCNSLHHSGYGESNIRKILQRKVISQIILWYLNTYEEAELECLIEYLEKLMHIYISPQIIEVKQD